MSKDILDQFGPNSSGSEAARATSGGCTECKELPYSPPVGPTTFSHKGPGLANHTNHGNCGTQGRH